MATNYPTSIDSFTNPTSGDTLDSPSHAAQHANINDAVEAVQTKLGVGAGTIGEWTSFTPSWTNLTVGNGAQTFNYAQVNDVVHVQFRLTIGSTTSIGAGPYFVLPVTPTAGYVDYHALGELSLYDVGTAVYAGQVVHFSGDDAYLRRYTVSGSNVSTAGITSTTPFTWTTGDQMMGQFTYRAA